jgi:hypothetical protein
LFQFCLKCCNIGFQLLIVSQQLFSNPSSQLQVFLFL